MCDIGDASRGSLSSYAYILMMIFYLQVTASSGLVWCNVTLPRVSSAESVSACAARAAGAPPHLRQAREHGGRLERLVLLRQVRYINTWLGDLGMTIYIMSGRPSRRGLAGEKTGGWLVTSGSGSWTSSPGTGTTRSWWSPSDSRGPSPSSRRCGPLPASPSRTPSSSPTTWARESAEKVINKSVCA